jgi:hypothetical protein
MDRILRIGLATIQDGSSRAALDSAQIARAFTPDSTEDPLKPLIDLQLDALQVRSGIAIVQTARDLTRYTLDIFA